MPSGDNIRESARYVDLSPRLVASTTVVASPAGASETIIASVTLPAGLVITSGVILEGWCAYTLGTSASACTVKIRQTSVSGTTIASTGAQTGGHNSAGLLVADDINGFDASPGDGQIYKLTLTVTGGAAASTVSAVCLIATAV